MIPVRTYYDYWVSVKERINSIDHLAYISTESELQQKIKEVEDGEIILVAIIPSSDSSAMDTDDIIELSTCLIYVLKKVDKGAMDDVDLLNEREETQTILSWIKTMMLEDAQNYNSGCPMMKGVNFSGMHTDPEYNYLGCNGWSLSFRLETKGF